MELIPIYDENTSISSNIWYSINGIGESPFMRVGHSCVHINPTSNGKGKIYLIGGANPSGSFNDVYILDLDTLAWDKHEDVANFDKGRYEHSCFQIDNSKIFIFGGSAMDETYNDILRFDIESNTMEKISNENQAKPSSRTLHGGVTYKNQLVVFGGGQNGKTPVNDSKIYIYNLQNNKWISIESKSSDSNLPSIRHGHVMINLNEYSIYVHGGMSDENLFDDLWLLDLKTLSWKSVEFDKTKAYPSKRAAHSGIGINDSLYLFGGLSEEARALDDLWKFDTVTNQWSLIEVNGDKPPSRLDFAYCKATFKTKVKTLNKKDKEQEASNEENSTSENTSNQGGNDDNYEQVSNFLIIHGGMDTEGNIFDDLFLIKLD